MAKQLDKFEECELNVELSELEERVTKITADLNSMRGVVQHLCNDIVDHQHTSSGVSIPIPRRYVL